jgi:hypothetical protein
VTKAHWKKVDSVVRYAGRRRTMFIVTGKVPRDPSDKKWQEEKCVACGHHPAAHDENGCVLSKCECKLTREV